MAEETWSMGLTGGPGMNSRGFPYFAGFRYWTSSLLPVRAGTTLPFWLRPPGFSFRWLGAIEFLIATALWTMVDEHITRKEDEQSGRSTMLSQYCSKCRFHWQS